MLQWILGNYMSEVDSLEVAFHESARAVKSGLLDSAKTLTESRKHNNWTFKIKGLKHV